MRGLKHDVSLRIVKLLAVCLITLPFALCWNLYYANHTAALFARNARLYVFILYVFLYIFFGRTFDAFLVSYSRISELAYSQMLAACMSDGLTAWRHGDCRQGQFCKYWHFNPFDVFVILCKIP